MRVPVTVTTEIDLTIETAASWFANMSDEEQADFFVEVAKAALKWKCQGHWATQFWLVGRHLRDCECSTDDARELVRNLASGMGGK
jgi:hypothetical protein